MTQRVVITGAGILCGLGTELTTVAGALEKGRSAVVAVPEWAELGLASTVAGLVPGRNQLEIPNDFSPDQLAAMPMSALFCALAAKKAAALAGLDDATLAEDSTGCIVGTGISGTVAVANGTRRLDAGQARRVNPFTVLQAMSSSASSSVASVLGIGGRSYSISSACSTSAHAIGHAFELIRGGLLETAVAGGGEQTDSFISAAFNALRTALSTQFNHDPEAASRPFAADRGGFVLGEGAGIVILEKFENAAARGAPILAEVVGYAANSDRHDLVLPPPDGAPAAACMIKALDDASLAPGDVDYVSAHATGTVAGDAAEIAALNRVFDRSPAVSALKSMIGHTLGGAGAIELITSMMMLSGGFVAPTLNLNVVDPAAAKLDLVTGHRRVDLEIALSNSFGFGGTNASLVIKRGPDAGHLLAR